MNAVWHLVGGAPLALGIIVLSGYDVRQGILPDVWVLLVAAGAGFYRLCFVSDWTSALLGLCVGGVTLALLRWLSRGGLGGGDVKLGAALGLWLGAEASLLMLALAFVLGGVAALVLLLAGTRKRTLPFGPFLGVAAWLVYLFGAPWLLWYEALLC